MSSGVAASGDCFVVFLAMTHDWLGCHCVKCGDLECCVVLPRHRTWCSRAFQFGVGWLGCGFFRYRCGRAAEGFAERLAKVRDIFEAVVYRYFGNAARAAF